MEREEKKPNPVEKINLFFVATLMYMFPIFKKTYYEGMTQDDLYKPLDVHKSENLGEQLEKIWREENTKHNKTALHRALFKLFGKEFMFIGMVKLFDECLLVIVMPVGIARLVSFFEKDQHTITLGEAYVAALGIILGLLLNCFVSHPSMMSLMHMAMKMRVSCSALLYRKTLRLSSTAMASTTIGEAVNLLSNDVSKFDQGFILAHYVYIGPIQTAVGTYLIYREIGIAAFFGVAFLLSFIPAQIWIGKRCSTLRLKTALRTDERVRLMNEIIGGIQVIKMYCWEKPFAQLINLARTNEMKAIRSNAILISIIYSFEMFVTKTSVFISVFGYYWYKGHISASNVFAIAAVYNVLRPVITILFSVSITSIAQVHISLTRMQKFLSYEELETRITEAESTEKSTPTGSNERQITLKSMSAKWSKDSTECNLKDINLKINPRQTVAVIGPVGSGKSTLLNVFLQELQPVHGDMYLNGTVSYAAQEPWLFNATVQQNILFGADMDENRYNRVITACALKSDFKLLPHGDKTLVGERGKSLSGGQKARINLARCLYKQADIYLLDDPLSAVDAHVGKHLYEECIQSFLKDKICVLTTHQLQFLKDVDQIVVMKDGRVEMVGNWDKLQKSGSDFTKTFKTFKNEKDEDDHSFPRKRARSRIMSVVQHVDEEDVEMIEEEEMHEGAIDFALYYEYLKSGGPAFVISLLAISFVSCQAIANAGDFFLREWVNIETVIMEKYVEFESIAKDEQTRDRIIFTYCGFIVATIVFSIINSVFFMMFFIIAATNLHNISFLMVIHATLRFFNTNPSGRILNRFSKDLGYIDEYIPPVFFEMLQIALLLAGSLILTFFIEPFLVVPGCILLIIFYVFRRFYIETSRSVKRMEGISKLHNQPDSVLILAKLSILMIAYPKINN